MGTHPIRRYLMMVWCFLQEWKWKRSNDGFRLQLAILHEIAPLAPYARAYLCYQEPVLWSYG